MDILFDPEQLVSIEAKDLPHDSRYSLIKGLQIYNILTSYYYDNFVLEAVRNKFRLSKDELETMWVWLHTVILAKRRTIDAKLKKTQPLNRQLTN